MAISNQWLSAICGIGIINGNILNNEKRRIGGLKYQWRKGVAKLIKWLAK